MTKSSSVVFDHHITARSSFFVVSSDCYINVRKVSRFADAKKNLYSHDFIRHTVIVFL